MIDEGLFAEWPEAVQQALEAFKQGHLVEGPPFVYVASARYPLWSLTREGNPDLPEEVFELAEDQRPPYGLITTQTCDVQEKPPQQNPWLQVAPVYQLRSPDETTTHLLSQNRISRYVVLKPPTLVDACWVADLRLEVPVEKGWLVGRTPIDAFPSEDEYEDLALRLAATRERPALAESVIEAVVRPLQKWLKTKPGRRAAATIHEVRLHLGGTRLRPTAAGLLVISAGEVLSGPDREAWDRWWDKTTAATMSGPALLPPDYVTLDSISARTYVESVPLNFGYMSRE